MPSPSGQRQQQHALSQRTWKLLAQVLPLLRLLLLRLATSPEGLTTRTDIDYFSLYYTQKRRDRGQSEL